MENGKLHEPVMIREVVEALHIENPARITTYSVAGGQAHYIDATLGMGGHSQAIICLGGSVLGIEADEESLELAKKNLSETCPTPEGNLRGSKTLVHGNFRDVKQIAGRFGFNQVEGILLDLGISSYHLASHERGFSFQDPKAPLDMRLSRGNQGVRASDLLKVLNLNQLTEVFGTVLPRNLAFSLVKKIVKRRKLKEIESVGDFLDVIGEDFKVKPKLHPATLPFLALRIAVNSELENLRAFLPQSVELLKPKGRLVIISFHSIEDRIVKTFFRECEKQKTASLPTKKPIIPSEDEINKNPKSRSAKLRVLEKI